jgi:polar amino acid transport system substrate-binding protein
MQAYTIVLMWCCLATYASANTITLVTGNNYAPFTDQKLPNRGMTTEIVELAFQEAGFKPIIEFRPWKRGYEETKKGRFAATFPYIKTEERLRDFYYSDPINTVHTRIFVVKDSPIQQIEDLRGRRLCVPLGYAVSKRFAELIQKDIDYEDSSPTNLPRCLKMMLLGRKDFFIINEITGWMTIQKTFSTKERFRTLDTIFEEETHHLIVSKAYPNAINILNQFNQGLASLKRKGALTQIINRHLKGILE